MKVYQFNKEKNKNRLPMELGRIEETPLFDFSSMVHCTDFFEILILKKGKGQLQLDSHRIELEDNLFLFVSPFQKRRWFVDRADLKGYFLIFEQNFLNEFFSDKLFVYRMQYFFNQSIPTILTTNRRLFAFKDDIFDEMLAEIKHPQKDSSHLMRSILYYILTKLNREFCAFHHLEGDTQISHIPFLFREALEKNIREKQQVNEYAQLLGISRIRLNSMIKKQFGKSASSLIKERLLSELKDELLFSDKTIAQIAFDLNFSEPHHLIRFFRRSENETPTQYRMAYQNGSF